MVKLRFIIILIFLIVPIGSIFSEEINKPNNSASQTIENGFEKAMEKIENKKRNEQEKLKSELQPKLNTAVEAWISAKSDEREKGIDRPVEQNWVSSTGVVPGTRQDYFLSGYIYEIVSKDIVESGSLVSPYAGYLSVNEKLFVETYYHPDNSHIDDHLYVIKTPIKINFQYNDGNFKPADVKKDVTTIEKGWPEEVKKKLVGFL
ncbi:MAG: hypothetical protein NTU54_04505 [Candidatus Omnitrophica bacterium]|nr:hypothetical protein [Candidatus Omnitrophota bacterium]